MTRKKTIFKLIQIEYCDEKPRYPSFEVCRVTVGYFSILEKAEEAMKKNVASKGIITLHHLFGFLIEEYSLDKSVYFYPESIRSYLPDGSLWDVCLLSQVANKEGDLEPFFGRPADKMRFRTGDLVEVLHHDTVTLEIVAGLPFTPEELQKKLEVGRKTSPDYSFRLDYSDDSYYTLNQDGVHSHPASVCMFPTRFNVSKKLIVKLLSYEYLDYVAYYADLKEYGQ